MNEYEITYVTKNGFTDTVVISAPTSAVAWEMFSEMGFTDVVKADVKRINID